MKKVIFAALLVASIGTLSSFRADSVANKKEVGTADNKKEVGTADNKKEVGTADAHRRTSVDNKKEVGTAD